MPPLTTKERGPISTPAVVAVPLDPCRTSSRRPHRQIRAIEGRAPPRYWIRRNRGARPATRYRGVWAAATPPDLRHYSPPRSTTPSPCRLSSPRRTSSRRPYCQIRVAEGRAPPRRWIMRCRGVQAAATPTNPSSRSPLRSSSCRHATRSGAAEGRGAPLAAGIDTTEGRCHTTGRCLPLAASRGH